MTGYALTYPGNNTMQNEQCCKNVNQATFLSDKWDQESFMRDQCNEICIHKWIESQKAGRDLGSLAVKDWITKYAKQFREYAISSGKYIKRN